MLEQLIQLQGSFQALITEFKDLRDNIQAELGECKRLLEQAQATA